MIDNKKYCDNSDNVVEQVIEKVPERVISRMFRVLGDGFLILCKAVAVALIISSVAVYLFLIYQVDKINKEKEDAIFNIDNNER